jgi:hypothetical protein
MLLSSILGSDMAEPLAVFLPHLQRRLGMYVPRRTYLAVCSFIQGYACGSRAESLNEFHDWLVARSNGRPELAWPWLVLCELPHDQFPRLEDFTEEQDRLTIDLLFDLLFDYFDVGPESNATSLR